MNKFSKHLNTRARRQARQIIDNDLDLPNMDKNVLKMLPISDKQLLVIAKDMLAQQDKLDNELKND